VRENGSEEKEAEEETIKMPNGVTRKIKRELGYMKVGAKRLPSFVGQKIKEYYKASKQMGEQRKAAQAEARLLEKLGEAEAFKEESRRQAVLRGRAAGVARAKRTGAGSGLFGQLQDVGTRLQPYVEKVQRYGVRLDKSDMFGMGELQKRGQQFGSASSYIFSGLSEKRREHERKRHKRRR